MTLKPPSDTLQPAALAFAGLTAAILGWVALSLVATPSGFADDLAPLRAAAATPAPPETFAASASGAICADMSGPALGRAEASLREAVASAGLQLNQFSLAPGAAEGERLSPVKITVAASGPYEAVLAGLDGLGRRRPQVFVETLDLVPRGLDVEFTLVGTFYCWTSARP